MIKELMKDTEARMIKTREALATDLKSVRTGRASPAILDRVLVNYYGAPTGLNKLAVISAPEPQLLVVRPFDPTSIPAIEKAIMTADLGLNPGNDGRIVRVPIPRLTEKRRRDLVKVIKRRVEEAKVSLRNIRRDTLDDLRDFEHEKLISEDDKKRGQDDLQKLTDRYVKFVDEIGKRKEQDIMAI